MLLGKEEFRYGAGEAHLTTIDVPASSHVTRATPDGPFLGMLIRIDESVVERVAQSLELPERRPSQGSDSPISVHRLDPGLLDALSRLLSLIDEPEILPAVAPGIMDEVVARLLTGSHGPHLWQVARREAPRRGISTAIAWMKLNFRESITVGELAARAHMSPSTLRKHFRATTGTSPIDYLRTLRLLEARDLMMHGGLTAQQAGRQVGIGSPSYFSRAYVEMFGTPPRQHVEQSRMDAAGG